MKDTKELLDFEIYPNLDRAETVKDLNPQDKGCPPLKIEAFRELVGNPESAVSWKAKRLLSKHSKNGEHNTDRVKG